MMIPLLQQNTGMIQQFRIYSFALLLLRLAPEASQAGNPSAKEPPARLWYQQPATKWDAEALPVGNGRIGAMLYGGAEKERVQFNEQSLWSGDNNWDGEYKTGDRGFGSYRNFGEFEITFRQIGEVEKYVRALDIQQGIHTTSFQSNGVAFTRTAFASYPDQVIVFRYSAGKKKALSGRITLNSAQGARAVAADNTLSFSGEMPNSLKYAAKIKAVYTDGKVVAADSALVFENCSTLTLYLFAHTNYYPDYASGWRGKDPMTLIRQEEVSLQNTNYDKIKERHVKDVSTLMQAASIDIGTSPMAQAQLPTDQRLKKYQSGETDPDLEELVFQYGRYLLVSSSRPGGLPANLQGLWNNSNTPAWASDYHNNINIQMNYWGAESTNLSECHLPLIDYIVAQQEPCRIASRKAFGENVRGWTARTSQSIFGGNGWEWNIPASAWYAQHIFEHWAFTRDDAYLRKTGYPVLKEICQFWEDRLKKMPDGALMVPNGWSPEHGPREDGVMHDQQLVWDLFQNYLDAAAALGIDTAYQRKVAAMQKALAPNKIGKWGQLQEWQADRDDPNDQHRHTSHLFAVYPGRQINRIQTPALATAAEISLRSRSGNYGANANTPFTVASTVGDSRRSWTWPWRCALWARLGDGEKAGIMIRGLLQFNMLPNLFATHPPFQMDGNFGITGAIPEMLLQSHAGVIQLLPAIPASWKNGSFRGLRARGGYVVDCRWENGMVTMWKVRSAKPGKLKVQVNGKTMETTSERL